MLAIKQLSAGYGQSLVLHNINMEAPKGQVVCLMGRNGVGKTTTLKTIMGLIKAKTGKITFDGKDITNAAPHIRAQAGIGYVPQGRGIFPHLTVYENLLMGFEAAPRQKIALSAVEEMYDMFPILKTMQKRVAGTLSGGQQQQLAIARVLVRKPRMLVLDEPTEGIQPSIVQQIEEVIHKLRDQGEMSILLVEQFLDFALGIADFCYVIDNGEIVSSGPANALQESDIKEYLTV
jgi:urea transport system ATP-binding protein